MAEIFGIHTTRQELQRRVGHLTQAGGVQLLRVEEGPAQGVRLLEFRTGSGLIFKVAMERGMDVGFCEYKGLPLGWIPPTLLPGPWYFEQQTGFGWLRTAMGGFCTSCGMLHIGNPESDSVEQYRFGARREETYGVHDRMAMLPGRLLEYGETWEGDECILKASGEVVQAQVYGENLVLRRSYRARLGEKRYFMRDEITNEGYYPTPQMLLYHINIGYPFVDEGSILLLSASGIPRMLAGDAAALDREEYRHFSAPGAWADLQAFEFDMQAGQDSTATAAIINPRLGDGGMGVYIRYKPRQFPGFVLSRMMGEGHYFACLEPCTNSFGRDELHRTGKMPVLHPGDKREFDLEVGVLDGKWEIDLFRVGLAE